MPKMTDEEFDRELRNMVQQTVAGMTAESQIAYLDQQRIAQRAAQQRERNRQAMAQKEAQRAEARRLEAEYRFGQDVRNRLFAAHPHAEQADFERLWPKLRDQELMRIDGAEASVEAERQNPRYNI